MNATIYEQKQGTGEQWSGVEGLVAGGSAESVVSGEGNTAILVARGFKANAGQSVSVVRFRVIGTQPPGSNDSEYFLEPSGAPLSSEGGGVFSARVSEVPGLTPAAIAADAFGIGWAGYSSTGGQFTISRVELELS